MHTARTRKNSRFNSERYKVEKLFPFASPSAVGWAWIIIRSRLRCIVRTRSNNHRCPTNSRRRSEGKQLLHLVSFRVESAVLSCSCRMHEYRDGYESEIR